MLELADREGLIRLYLEPASWVSRIGRALKDPIAAQQWGALGHMLRYGNLVKLARQNVGS